MTALREFLFLDMTREPPLGKSSAQLGEFRVKGEGKGRVKGKVKFKLKG